MKKEVTMEEIIQLINESQRDFIIHVEFGKEEETDAEEK